MSAQPTPTPQILPPPGDLARGELVPRVEGRDDARERRKQDKTRQTTYADLETWLKNVDKKVDSINAEGELERQRVIGKMRRFYAGDQFVRLNRKGQWESRKKQSDALYCDPVLSAFVDTNVATRMRSRPRLKFTARSEDRVDKSEVAKYAQELWDDASRSLFTASERERENKNLELAGDTFCLLYFDPKAEGTEVRVPVLEKNTVTPSFASVYCPSCGKTSPPAPGSDAFKGVATCGECGYGHARVLGAQPFEAQVQTGFQDVPAGDVRAIFPDPAAVRVIGSTGKIADALVVAWDSLIMRGVLEETYPDQTFTSAGDDVPPSLQSERSEMQGGEQFEPVAVKRRWLSPLLFGGYTFQKETTLANGKVVPEGTKLKDLYPSGAYYCFAGGKLVDIYEQSIGSCWIHCPNSTSEGFNGLGSWDLLPLQEMVNELISLQFMIEVYDSLSPTLYRTGKINAKKIPNKPGAMIPVSNGDEDKPLSYAMARVDGGGNNSQAAQLGEQIKGSMQGRYGSFSGSSGVPDIKASGTATGIAIIQEQSMGRMGPSLALQAEMEVERAYIVLELRQQNWVEEMYETLDRKVGGDAGKWFRECDVRRDIRIEVIPESYYPQTEAQRREDFTALLNVAAMLQAGRDPAVADALFRRGVELYGKGLVLEQFQHDRVEARIRLERMRQAARFLESEAGVPVYLADGTPSPQMIEVVLSRANLVPEEPGKCLSVRLDRHPEYVQAYSQWLLTSEGRGASGFERGVVNTAIEKHRLAQAEQAQYAKQLQYQAQIPDKMAQMVDSHLDAEQQQNMQGVQAEEAQAAQMQQAEHAQGLQQQDREHEAIVGAAASGSIPVSDALTLKGALHGG
jgi:hypothetical protein